MYAERRAVQWLSLATYLVGSQRRLGAPVDLPRVPRAVLKYIPLSGWVRPPFAVHCEYPDIIECDVADYTQTEFERKVGDLLNARLRSATLTSVFRFAGVWSLEYVQRKMSERRRLEELSNIVVFQDYPESPSRTPATVEIIDSPPSTATAGSLTPPTFRRARSPSVSELMRGDMMKIAIPAAGPVTTASAAEPRRPRPPPTPDLGGSAEPYRHSRPVSLSSPVSSFLDGSRSTTSVGSARLHPTSHPSFTSPKLGGRRLVRSRGGGGGGGSRMSMSRSAGRSTQKMSPPPRF
eukprot:PhM_4_TR19064/c0_g1_i1/m.54618